MADNLSEIKTVKDLLDFNTRNHELTEDELNQKFDEIIDLGPRTGLIICKKLLHALLGYHVEKTEEEISKNNIDAATVWSVDTTRLNIAFGIVSEIEL